MAAPQRNAFLVMGVVLLLAASILLNGRQVTHFYISELALEPYPQEIQKKLARHEQKPWSSIFANIHPYENATSPACMPHFKVASRPEKQLHWSSSSKFTRLFFYHARKAGGTSMRYYFEKVAKHHGLEFVSKEYEGSEIPGTNDKTTFYVTHLRDPVERSISHFKYEGRWDCKQLTTNYTLYNPSEENANKLETWNSTDGHYGDVQKFVLQTRKRGKFYLVKCAAGCYTQWFASLASSSFGVPVHRQAEIAREVLLRFNFIVVLEKLKDPSYVAAVEGLFGVPNLTLSKSAWCEIESHRANTKFPLQIKNQTFQGLIEVNRVDTELYNNISQCLADGVYDFPTWDESRFEANETLKMHYEDFPKWKHEESQKRWNEHMKNQGPKTLSPACKPHFNAATADGKWNSNRKFKRLFFYHSRKAGGSSLRYYFEKVARHHGIEYVAVEYEKAENPGSHDNHTFYVTNLREPVARSISGFKFEGRWGCDQLIYNNSFVATEENANKIETWNKTGGHKPMKCKFKGNDRPPHFFLGACAVNCFIQWFSGHCPNERIPWPMQYETAAAKLIRYNFILVIEKLSDPKYVAAVEAFFGVPGVNKKKMPLCEPVSNNANKLNPLVIQNSTLAKLRELNKFDIMLYERLTECLESGSYNFPVWNEKRFDTNSSLTIPHGNFDKWKDSEREKQRQAKLTLR